MLWHRTWNRLRPLLWPVAMLYWGLSWWRNFFYNIGFFISRRVSIPVLSIGNLSVGGTGKTPATIFTAAHLTELGFKVGIVSRGYGRNSTGTVIISDEEKILVHPDEAGDEPYLMASRLRGIPVLVDEDRYRGATVMINRFYPDIIILDDAFQHRGLTRDCDLVLLDSSAPKSDYRIFPYGSLREHLGALKRADLVVWTRTNTQAPNPAVIRKIDRMGVPQIYSVMESDPTLIEAVSNKQIPVENLQKKQLLAFCGIARPVNFYHSLISIGLEPDQVRYYPDHHRYTIEDLAYLSGLGKEGDLAMVTTEKDVVKLSDDFLAKNEVYALRMEFRLSGDRLEIYQDLLADLLPLPRVTRTAGEA
ncbi:tetraacyldisaccharide 4'-kinase [Candidatus Neomarinimicrobiota bacterium]